MDLTKNSEIRLIVGLGNPGSGYVGTRHNLGFFLVDRYVHRKGGCWSQDVKSNSYVATVDVCGKKVFCQKPQTFMNLSGDAVQKFCAYRKLEASEVMVICDDVSIPWGRFKVSTIPGDAGHNGIKDIAKKMGDGFVRYRIGLGTKPDFMSLDSFVLSHFTEEEQHQLPMIAETFENNLEVLIDKGVTKGLNFIERN